MIIACSTTAQIPAETANSVQVMMTCESLLRCGQEVQLLIPGSEPIDFEAMKKQYGLHCGPFPVHRLPSKPSLHRIDYTLATMKKDKAIHADVHYSWTIQAAAAAALRGEETAFEIHDLPTGGGIRWFDLYTQTHAPKKILCITRALRDRLLNMFSHLKAEDCLITPNGFSPEDYENLPDLVGAKQILGFNPDRPAVSCSGHLYAGRGADLFLSLAARFPEADFHWFGGTPDAVERNRAEARQSGLTNVTFHGFIDKTRLPLAQAACDILLMPYAKQIAGSGGGNSAEICSPMKMFEYMAEERCILSADLPVIHEVLDESCAVFCEPENIDSWENGLRTVLANTELRNRLSAEAKKRSSAYTWQKRAETYLNGRNHDQK